MRAYLALLLAIAACGDDAGTTTPDAPGGGSADAMPDSPMMVGCTYNEANDGANGVSATPEQTGISYTSKVTLCGNVNNGHFDTTEQIVDQDIYKLTFTADTDLIVHFTAEAAVLDELAVQIAQTNTRAGYGTWVDGHGTLVAHVTPGDWYITVGAFRDTDISSVPIAYKITVETDNAGRCAQVLSGGYSEAIDGGSSVGNDMIEYDSAADPTKRLTNAADTAEPSGVVAAPGMQYRLTGIAANVNASDDYTDRDTYELSSGTANELSIRLTWPGTTRDFDFLVVPQNTVQVIAAGLDNRMMEAEFETFAVKPNTTYWIWVGAYDGAALPIDYDVTICATTYTP
jgi:hypothetical protein